MERHSTATLLRVPAPSRQALSFCAAEPNALRQWLNALPRANLGETARQLYQALTELNELKTSSAQRLLMLESMRPEVYVACRHLERYFLDQPIVLDQRARKVASLCQALQSHLATGYKLVVVDEIASGNQQVLGLAMQRAIRSLYAALIRASQLYCPVPDRLWLELHQLYRMAVHKQLQRASIQDEQAHHIAAMTIEQSYLAALLLGSARCNQLRQRTIGQLGDILESWSALARMQKATLPSSLLVVAPKVDAPPRYRALVTAEEMADCIGVDPQPLAQAIRDLLALPLEKRSQMRLPGADTIDTDLLRHLHMAWGEATERSFQRIPGKGTLNVCLGMSSVHYYLAGQRTFDELLDNSSAPRPARFSLVGGANDIWNDAFDARPKTDASLIDDQIEYLQRNAQATYPVFSLEIVNQSPGGYCLAWSSEVPSQLQAGELLGLHTPGSERWNLAIVRWIRQVRGGGTQMGVELAGPQVQPCGVRLLRDSESGSQYLRALLLPEVSILSQPAMLITPRLPFQEGHKVQIHYENRDMQALLSTRLSGTGSYSKFQFRTIDGTTSRNTGASTRWPTELAIVEEDFDSLWKSL